MAMREQVFIYHNPDCTTSRKVLARLRQAAMEPTVIEYLKTPPDRAALEALLDRLGMTPRQVLRSKEMPYETLGLADRTLPDEVLIEAILAYPILLERPIVLTPRGASLCRPAEKVEALIGTAPAGASGPAGAGGNASGRSRSFPLQQVSGWIPPKPSKLA